MPKALTLHRGFTLTELLIAIAIIGILAALAIIAINPQKQISDSKDAKRRAQMKVILDGVYQYQIDTLQVPKYDNGNDAITSTPQYICTFPDSITCRIFNHSYLYPLVGTYIAELPADPDNIEQFHNSYQIWVGTDNRIYINAPLGNDGTGLQMAR